MADVEILSTGDDAPAEDDVLELGEAPADTIEGAKSGEPIDDAAEFPDTFDEDAAGEETPLIKSLREKAKTDAREKRDMAAQIAQLRGQTAPVRKPKPTLEEYDWDEDKRDAAFVAWQANEAAVDAWEKAPATHQNEQAQEFEQTRLTYKANAAKLGKPDFEAAETSVIETLDKAQQSTILLAAKDPARFIYALGRSPNRLAQLSLITNPIKLAAEVARIEGARTVARKDPPNIDTPLRGGARLSSANGDEQESKLIAQAQKTGDVTPLREYRRAQRAKAA